MKTKQNSIENKRKRDNKWKLSTVIEALKSFWSNTWGHKDSYNKKAKWIKNINGIYKHK